MKYSAFNTTICLKIERGLQSSNRQTQWMLQLALLNTLMDVFLYSLLVSEKNHGSFTPTNSSQFPLEKSTTNSS